MTELGRIAVAALNRMPLDVQDDIARRLLLEIRASESAAADALIEESAQYQVSGPLLPR